MKTGNCKYEEGQVDSCFDCKCDECQESVKQYEAYLNKRAEENEYQLIKEGEFNGLSNRS